MTLRKLVPALLAAAACAAVAAPAAEAAACPAPATARSFLPWLDLARYHPVPDGGLEVGTGWRMTGAARYAAGAEPWGVIPGSRRRVAELRTGATLTSPAFCVSLAHPTFRAFARNTGARSGALAVTVVFPLLGRTVTLPVGVVVDGSGRWRPTPVLPVVANLLDLLRGPGDVRIRFTALGAGAVWQLDDVMLDPFSKR